MSGSEEQKERKRTTLEDVAEETGELVGKGIKKTWSAVKSFSKGLADTLEPAGKEEATALHCPYCGALLTSNAVFCSSCGKNNRRSRQTLLECVLEARAILTQLRMSTRDRRVRV